MAADQHVNERVSDEVDALRVRTAALRWELPDAVWMDYGPRVLQLCCHISSIKAELESVEKRNTELGRDLKGARNQVDRFVAALSNARAELRSARQLLRDIKQNIDSNGPDRPDLYARLTAALETE